MKYYKHSENITLMTSMYQSQGLNKCLHFAQNRTFLVSYSQGWDDTCIKATELTKGQILIQ